MGGALAGAKFGTAKCGTVKLYHILAEAPHAVIPMTVTVRESCVPPPPPPSSQPRWTTATRKSAPDSPPAGLCPPETASQPPAQPLTSGPSLITTAVVYPPTATHFALLTGLREKTIRTPCSLHNARHTGSATKDVDSLRTADELRSGAQMHRTYAPFISSIMSRMRQSLPKVQCAPTAR